MSEEGIIIGGDVREMRGPAEKGLATVMRH
jgi:hypothetical protein